MEKKQFDLKRMLLFCAVILLLLIFQKVLGMVGRGIADMISYGNLTPIKPIHGIQFTI